MGNTRIKLCTPYRSKVYCFGVELEGAVRELRLCRAVASLLGSQHRLLSLSLSILYLDELLFYISPLVIDIDGLDECQLVHIIQSDLVKYPAASFRSEYAISMRILLKSASRPCSLWPLSVPRIARVGPSELYSPEKDIYSVPTGLICRAIRAHWRSKKNMRVNNLSQ